MNHRRRLLSLVAIVGLLALAATGEAATASDIAARVKETTGDDQGIRIRIERTKRATAGAQSELLQALDGAGIARESVQQMTGFLE